MDTRRLVVLKVSPWSERAKWVLDHHRIAYRTIEHVPFLGERRLRRLVGAEKKRATAPVLLENGQVFSESWDIAVHADRIGEGAKLIGPDREREVRQWNDLADETMTAGRNHVIASLLRTPEALDETLPATMPRWMRPVFRPLARQATLWFARKYELGLKELDRQAEKVRWTLGTLQNALAKSPNYLLGTFSYADIVMAVCLQGISPVDDRYLFLGPGTRRAWTRADLASEFSDLVAWRDELYARHRAAPLLSP